MPQPQLVIVFVAAVDCYLYVKFGYFLQFLVERIIQKIRVERDEHSYGRNDVTDPGLYHQGVISLAILLVSGHRARHPLFKAPKFERFPSPFVRQCYKVL